MKKTHGVKVGCYAAKNKEGAYIEVVCPEGGPIKEGDKFSLKQFNDEKIVLRRSRRGRHVATLVKRDGIVKLHIALRKELEAENYAKRIPLLYGPAGFGRTNAVATLDGNFLTVQLPSVEERIARRRSPGENGKVRTQVKSKANGRVKGKTNGRANGKPNGRTGKSEISSLIKAVQADDMLDIVLDLTEEPKTPEETVTPVSNHGISSMPDDEYLKALGALVDSGCVRAATLLTEIRRAR